MDSILLFYIFRNASRLFALVYVSTFSIMGIVYIVKKIRNRNLQIIIWVSGLLLLLYSMLELFQIVSLLLR